METRDIEVRAVLFDVDDTLYACDSFAREAEDALLIAARRQGVSASQGEALRALFKRPTPEALLAALSPLVARPEELSRVYDAFVPLSITPFAGVRTLLSTLRSRGVALGLVTNGYPPRQRAKVRALGIEHLVDTIVCADESEPKPSPTPFLLAAQRLHVPPANCLVVGDRPDVDVEGARRAGMRSLRILGGRHAWRTTSPHALGEAPPEEAWEEILSLVSSSG